jgi:hypothetical protein
LASVGVETFTIEGTPPVEVVTFGGGGGGGGGSIRFSPFPISAAGEMGDI